MEYFLKKATTFFTAYGMYKFTTGVYNYNTKPFFVSSVFKDVTVDLSEIAKSSPSKKNEIIGSMMKQVVTLEEVSPDVYRLYSPHNTENKSFINWKVDEHGQEQSTKDWNISIHKKFE